MFKRFFVLTLGAVFGLAFSPSLKAADLGGDCCADLEERVAELEATTVRKGNKKVSLKLSGFVSKSVMYWDDGDETNVYVVDTNGGTLSSEFTLSGSAKIDAEWSAGFELIIEVPGGGNATAVNQNNDNAGGGIAALVSSMYVESEHLGELSWGKQSQASDNTALLVDLSGTIIQDNYVFFHGLSMLLRPTGATPGAVGLATATWGSAQFCDTSRPAGGIALDCNGAVLNNVRYDSPTIAGFTFSASWGEDDFWDVALTYAGAFGDFKFKAAAAYSEMRDENYATAGGGNNGFQKDAEFWQIGASGLHVPTGLFIYAAYIEEDADSTDYLGVQTGITDGPDVNGWYVKAGIQVNHFMSHGKTVLYGHYKQVDDGYFGFLGGDVCAAGANTLATMPICTNGAAVGDVEVVGSEVEVYGAGIVQYIDAAALQLFAKWQHAEVDFDFVDDNGAINQDFEDLDIIMIGGVIFF